MDPLQQQWQQAFQQATPDIDVKALANQVKKARYKEQFKAWADLMLGIAVSIYVLYVTLFMAQDTKQTLLFAVLVPIPAGFSLWMFKLRREQWQHQNDNVAELLNFKKRKLQLQEKYWRMNLFGMLLVMTGVMALAIYNSSTGSSLSVWLLQIAINGFVTLLVGLRYRYVKRTLPAKLEAITQYQ